MDWEFFKYTEILPHRRLQGIVTHYRLKQASLITPLSLPDFSPIFQGLIFNLHPLDDVTLMKRGEHTTLDHKVYFVGQALSPAELRSSEQRLDLIAVNFTPTGVFRLTGINLQHFTDRIIDAEYVFGKRINALYHKMIELNDRMKAVALIDDFLVCMALESKKTNHNCIRHSMNILHRQMAKVDIKKLHEEINSSPRTLERAFKSEVGMTPKMYQRLLRFNCVRNYIDHNISRDWWDIIDRFGYFDQSHFISEFRLFSGKTPMQYFKMLSDMKK